MKQITFSSLETTGNLSNGNGQGVLARILLLLRSKLGFKCLPDSKQRWDWARVCYLCKVCFGFSVRGNGDRGESEKTGR